jgi:hypothetical protein
MCIGLSESNASIFCYETNPRYCANWNAFIHFWLFWTFVWSFVALPQEFSELQPWKWQNLRSLCLYGVSIVQWLSLMHSLNACWGSETEANGHLLTFSLRHERKYGEFFAVLSLATKALCIVLSSKTRRSQWNTVYKGFPVPKTSRPHLLAALCSLLFLGHSEFMRVGAVINYKWFIELLQKLKECICRFCPYTRGLTWTCKWLQRFIALAPSDLHHFPNLKERLRGLTSSVVEVNTAAKMLSLEQDTGMYCDSVMKLRGRWWKRADPKGNYVEK